MFLQIDTISADVVTFSFQITINEILLIKLTSRILFFF